MLKETIKGLPSEAASRTHWRASQVGGCPTQLWHTRMHHKRLSLPGRVAHLFDDGRAHEKDIVERWLEAGVNVLHSCLDSQLEVLAHFEPHVVGHPDGVIDVPRSFPRTLDYADENFNFSYRFYMLEITSANCFTFARFKHETMREVLYQKFVQIQFYLNSPEVRDYGTDCCVVTVKNKNNSDLYEEGISFEPSIVSETVEVLKHLEECVELDKDPGYRCNDHRRNYCLFRQYCYGAEESMPTSFVGTLRGEDLKEVEQLLEVVSSWRKGKELVDMGEELVNDARTYFEEVLMAYKVGRISIQDVVAQFVEQKRRSVDYDLLLKTYCDAYKACVSEKPIKYIRVS